MTHWIVADHVVANDGPGTVYAPGVIEVDAGVIVSIGRLTGARPAGADVTDLGAAVVLPGLVNAHAHTPMSLMRGVAEGHSLLTMAGFLAVLRSREAHLTPELVPASVAVSCGDMIRHGTTAFADQYFYADRIAPTVIASGLRARIAWGIVELGDDAARARELAAATAFAESMADNDLVRGWVGPHAYFVDNQPEAMAAELALARRLGAGLHVHFSTSSEEDDYCAEHYGAPALEVLRALGMLDVPTILAHCNTVPVDQLPLLAGTRAAMTVVPSVAMMSGAPAAPVREALDAGVVVALGTDNPCNNTGSDLFEEMRTLGKLAAFTSGTPDRVTAREILRIATVGGHAAIDSGPLDGTLAPGAVADLIAIPVRDIPRGPIGAQSLESALVYNTSGASVSDSMVAGRWIMSRGTVIGLDLAAAAARQQADYDTLVERMRTAGEEAS
ncbi:amidohydrolase family protein [Galbitalea sp. SE-J8]|uniref:amidohydrolase family protein n=1 Tax=Galbitalea sp. SE-J8 TaxID=3054952 RepID=UPI00259CF996|nr:amidohydrolase family protein [Galbitalea sp. SE-J8]MDM4764206.1 amidohydrolase family protein [Galbitalea sp. SE-J8]